MNIKEPNQGIDFSFRWDHDTSQMTITFDRYPGLKPVKEVPKETMNQNFNNKIILEKIASEVDASLKSEGIIDYSIMGYLGLRDRIKEAANYAKHVGMFPVVVGMKDGSFVMMTVVSKYVLRESFYELFKA